MKYLQRKRDAILHKARVECDDGQGMTLTTFERYTVLTDEEISALRILVTHLFFWDMRQPQCRTAPLEEVWAKAMLHLQRPDTTGQTSIILETPTLRTHFSSGEVSRLMIMLADVGNDLCYMRATYLQASLVSDWDREHLVIKEHAIPYGAVLCGAVAPRDDEFGWIFRPLAQNDIPSKPALEEYFCPTCLALWKQAQ